MRLAVVGIALVVAVASRAWSAQEFDEKEQAIVVQQDVRSLLEALHAGYTDTLLKYTYPPIVAAMGGADAAKATLADVAAQLQALEMKLDSLVFPESPAFLEGSNGRRFAIVSTKSVFSSKGQKIESFNFQLGIREAGATQWTYVEGSRMTPQVLLLLLPDFPSGYQLPKISRERI